MIDKPSDIHDAESERRFNETLGRMMNTPAKPHDQMKKGREPKPAPAKD